MIHHYLIHGVTLMLDQPCPVLTPIETPEHADVCVMAAAVPTRLASPAYSAPGFELTESALLYRGGPFGARFLIEDGTSIRFQKNRACEDEVFWDQLLYPVLAAALWQRGFLVLHGSAALTEQGAVLVAGPSGAGKSTTVAAMVNQGWPLVADDLCALHVDEAGRLVLMPGSSQVHLFGESAAQLGIDVGGLQPKLRHRSKLATTAAYHAGGGPMQVHKIVWLDQRAEFCVRPVRGRQKADLLVRSIYGPILPQRLGAITSQLSRALQDITMVEVFRATGHWTLDSVLAEVARA